MDADLILAGGGLANSLIAYRVSTLRPDLRIVLLEQDATIGGNHTWSFHQTDLTDAQHEWLAPFIAHRWPGYDVYFPQRSRQVAIGYLSVTSRRLHDVLTNHFGDRCRVGTRVVEVEAAGVRLADDEWLGAHAVIDGRGDRRSPSMHVRYQKFFGAEVRTRKSHGLKRPIVMDATVEQLEGFRFVYLLPFSAHRVLIEDTRYSDTAALDLDALRSAVHAYAAARGWIVERVVREESGVLPVTLDGDIELFWRESRAGIPTAGLRAALFHPTTGYSLPDAVRCADLIASLPTLSSAAIDQAVRALSTQAWQRRGFYRLLNRMLFLAAEPTQRYRVLRRFYELPDALIGRFYAGETTLLDKARILIGRPPVPIRAALRCFGSNAARLHAGALR